MSTIRSISAVLFDWCDTLVSASKPHMLYTKSNMHLSPTCTESMAVCHTSSVTSAYAAPHRAEISRQNVSYNGICVNAYALELLKFLKANGVKTGIVSNKNGVQLRQEVCHLGLSEYFLVLIGGGDAREAKPSPEPIIVALEMLGIHPSESVLFVGDSDSDIEAALNAGCCPIGYNNFSNKSALSFSNFRELGIFIEDLLVRRYERTTHG